MMVWRGNTGFKRVVAGMLVLLSVANTHFAQSVGIGTVTPDPSARLDIWDTVRGLLIPRLTTQQRDAIQDPAHTLMIFNIDSFCLEVYDTVTHRWYTISCPRLCQSPVCIPTISGPAFACTGDTATYIALGCSDVFFQWSVPSGWTIISGQGTDTLYVIPDTADGTLSVRSCNQCGCGGSASLSVSADSCNTFCVAIGGPGSDLGYAIIQTSDGGYAIAGYTTSFGQGGRDVYVVKLDGSGNVQWTRTIGGVDDDVGRSIIQTADGGYAIAGETRSYGAGGFDVYVVKLDSAGVVQWTRTIGGTGNDIGHSIIQISDGSYVIAGEARIGPGYSSNVYVAKLDSSGNIVWTRIIGGAELDGGFSIIRASDEGFVVVGATQSYGQGNFFDVYVIKLDSNGHVVWTRTIGGASWDDYGFSIIQTTDGDYVIAGYTGSFGAGWEDVYVVKLDSMGNLLWARTIGGANHEQGYSIIQAADGSYVIAGYTISFGQGGSDVYVLKLDSNGNVVWTRTIGGASQDDGYSIIQTTDGGYVIAGVTTSFGSGGPDVYVVKLDANGNLVSCPGGCQIDSGGITGSGGAVSSGGITGSGGSVSSGGTTGSGGTLTNICP